MTARRRAILIGSAFAVLAVAGAVVLGRDLLPTAAAPSRLEAVRVARGTVVARQYETGMLAARDPVTISPGIAGDLEWIIENETWVEPGDRLYVIDDDEALKAVTEQRTKLLTAQQELSLGRLRRAHAEREQDLAVRAAERAADLADLRHRIHAARPKGGLHLIDVHRRLEPLEAETDQARTRYRAAQERYQQAQDAYQAIFDAWQESMDAITRFQTRIDEYRVRAAAEVAEGDESLAAEVAEYRAKLAAAESELARLQAGQGTLRAVRDATRAVRDATRPPRDEARAVLDQRLAAERELHIAIEIEKQHGLDLARLELDEQIAEMELAEAERQLAEGKTALAAGAVAATVVENLESRVRSLRTDLAVVQTRKRIAARPPPEAELVEKRLERERARAAATEARAIRERALAEIDAEIALRQAEVDRARYEIERRGTTFPAVVRLNIDYLERERAALEDGEEVRRDEIDTELAELRARLDELGDRAPNVGLAPVAGSARLAVRRWGKTFHAGDQVEEQDILMEIYPLDRLEVAFAVNQTRIARVVAGMPVTVTVPALDERRIDGEIVHIAGIGEAAGDEEASAVVVFDGRIALDRVDDDLRPGMSVIVAIELARRDDVVHLPRAAVGEMARDDDGWHGTVLIGPRAAPEKRRIHGDLVGEAFVVSEGLVAGDRVWRAAPEGQP